MAARDAVQPSKARPTSTTNVVKGRVEVRGTRNGVSGLVVRVFDLAPSDTSAAGRSGREAGVAAPVRWPLGSTVTQDGAFAVRFDDAAFRRGRSAATRPALLVSINAPEGGDAAESGLIFDSALRENAAREEYFLIQVDVPSLTNRGVQVPGVGGNAVGDPSAAGAAADTERERRASLRQELTAVRQRAVAEARAAEDAIEMDLRGRVLQHLTGLTADAPAWQRFVPPGGDVHQVSRASQQRSIARVINPEAEAGAATYLALSPEEFAALHVAGLPDAARVEQKLRQKNPTPSLLREDPTALACLQRRDANPFESVAAPAPPPPTPVNGQPSSTVDEKVTQLVEAIRGQDIVFGGGQPDQAAVADNIQNLRLSRGPADVPALYDFHNLQIAFDHIWEDARAEGVIEQAKAVYRSLKELGGDPKQALSNDGADPLRALARELDVVREAQARLAAPSASSVPGPAASGVIYLRPRQDTPSGADLDLVVDPLPPQPPPPPWPPVAGTTGVFDPGDGRPLSPPPDPTGTNSYPFTVFADKSINFGLLVTYRQCWEPVNYQVGRLAGTQTLAPRETISITARQVVKTTFNRKQIQASQEMRSEEANDTQREEAEIVSRAQSKSNFALTTEGGYDLGPLGEGSYTSSFGKDAESSSQETKRSFRESARKAALQYRNERRMELEVGGSSEAESIEKREISNTNDERAMTLIFYELQRRYRVSERLHRVVPVVLVGQYVPRPKEIDDNWVRRHDWILRRFLPDDSFKAALTYLATRERGDQIVLDELWAHMDTIRKSVRELKHEVLVARNEAAGRYAAIEQLVGRRAEMETAEDREGWFESAWEAVAGSDDQSKDALRILEDSAREGYERAVREERDLRSRMEREVTALQVATDAYTRARAEHTNQRLQIDRLLKHVSDNILHYLHAIWSYEQPDQRFFRHHTLPAPRLEAIERTYTLEETATWPVGVTPQPGKACYRVTFTTRLDDNLEPLEQYATLAELADLDRPLGFKGNYIIYPLKQSNALTDFMMTPYLDAELGLRDPDSLGNWTIEEFSDYIACLRESLSATDFQQIEPDLRRQYQAILADPLRDGEEIIVPTTSLYMQMLVDSGNSLEDFKVAHRLMDVLKAKAELRATEIDNLRRAKLVLTSQLDDPNVESVKNVFYHGDAPPHDGDE